MSDLDLLLDVQLLVLLLVANGSPIAVRSLLRDRFNRPVDGGLLLFDGRPLLGPSKTVRGLFAAISATSITALALGIAWHIGLLIGLLAMTGDLLSSFTKRRLGLAAGARATGLDHLPESVLPLAACVPLLGIGVIDIVLVTLAFMLTDMLLSRWLHHLGIGHHPH
jgi:CDP-2,3-bis-(O-geranylgeranyl)-sn-glycerol synthase